VETFTAFLLSVVAGARRFAHTSLLRADSLWCSNFAEVESCTRNLNPKSINESL
jgi:hypothetical protein